MSDSNSILPIRGKDFLPTGLNLGEKDYQKLRQKTLDESQKNHKFNDLRTTLSPKDRAKEIESAASQFEALLLHQMLSEMWKTVPRSQEAGYGLLSGSKEEEYFRDLFTEGLSDTLAKGQGIGIKQVIAREMYKKDYTDMEGKGPKEKGH